MENQCQHENCELFSEFICECGENIGLCHRHILEHSQICMRPFTAIYSKLDLPTQSLILGTLTNFIEKIEETMKKSTELATSLIKQIKENYKKIIIQLQSQKYRYLEMLNKCNLNKIKKQEFNSLWIAINNIEIKGLFNNLDFSEYFTINPSIKYLKEHIRELLDDSFITKLSFFTENYLADYFYRENIDFVSELEFNSIKKAIINSQKIVERSKLKVLNDNLTDSSFPHEDSSLESLFINEETLSPNKLNSQQLSCTFTKDIVIKVIKTHNSLNLLQNIEKKSKIPEFFNEINEFIDHLDYNNCLVNSQILQIFTKKFNLYENIQIIKNFFLLGKGDFFHSIFNELLEKTEEAQICDNFKQQINFQCLKGVFSENYKKVTLNFNLKNQKFSLNFDIDESLKVFFNERIMQKLSTIFEFLWNLKEQDFRVKSDKNDTALKRSYLNYDNLDCIHQYYILKFRLISLINMIFYFYVNEIIDTEWVKFENICESAASVEDLFFSFGKSIENIYIYCSEISPIHENFLDFIDQVKMFLQLREQMEIRENEIYNNQKKKEIIGKIHDLSHKINSFVINLKGNISKIPNEHSFSLRLRLNEFNIF